MKDIIFMISDGILYYFKFYDDCEIYRVAIPNIDILLDYVYNSKV